MNTNEKPEISEARYRLIIAGRALLAALDQSKFEPLEKFGILVMALMTALSEHIADEKVLRVAVDAVHARMLAHIEVFAQAQAERRERRSAVLQ